MLAAGVATAVWALVGAYYVYVLGLPTSPRPRSTLAAVLRSRRLVLPLLGTAAAWLALRHPETGTFAAAALLGIAWAGWRQWAFPGRPPEADVVVRAAPGETVVVLPSGDAVPRAWLWRHRVARVDGLTLVGCSLARSVAVFAGTAPRLDLPLDAGFSLSDGAWHGITGASLAGGAPLAVVPVRLATASAWAATHPDGRLRATAPVPPEAPPPVVRLPGVDAGGAGDDPGVWDGARWSVRAPVDGGESAAGIHVARWAARRLALTGAQE